MILPDQKETTAQEALGWWLLQRVLGEAAVGRVQLQFAPDRPAGLQLATEYIRSTYGTRSMEYRVLRTLAGLRVTSPHLGQPISATPALSRCAQTPYGPYPGLPTTQRASEVVRELLKHNQ